MKSRTILIFGVLLSAGYLYAQTLPKVIDDRDTNEVAEFLDQEIRRNRRKLGDLPTISGDNAWTGANTFTTTPTVNGISVLTLASTGTTRTSNYSNNNQKPSICISGTTITLTCNGSAIVFVHAQEMHTNTTQHPLLCVLKNGAFFDGQSQTSCFAKGENITNAEEPVGFTHWILSISGDTDFCITGGNTVGGLFTLIAPIHIGAVCLN